MRLSQAKINVESSEPIEQYQFGIRSKDMGFILEVLRNRMYKNPVRAIIREISANARDAHREVGEPNKPIRISLPTSLKKQLEIQDWGFGIRPRRMHEIFLNYGASTKRYTNKFTGAMGLGAKTPFAYSDSFTVVSVYGGKKRTYSAVIDETRCGKMDLISEYQTSESTGTTIIIPVKEQDFNAFAREALDLAFYWDGRHGVGARPKIENIPSVFEQDERPSAWLEGEGWAVFDKQNNRRSVIILDGIPYSCAASDLGDYQSQAEIRLINLPISIYFNTGELSLAATRDSLHFDDKTKAAIAKRLKRIANNINTLIRKNVEQKANLFEAERYWDYVKSFFGTLVIDTKSPIPIWNGVTLRGVLRTKKEGDNIEIESYAERINNKGMKKVSKKEVHKIRFDLNGVEFFVDDGVRGNKARAKQRVIDNGGVVFLIRFNDEATRKRWLTEENFEHVPHSKISNLPKPIRKRSNTQQAASNQRSWLWDTSYRGTRSSERSLRPTTIDKKNGSGVYFIIRDKRRINWVAGDLTNLDQTIYTIINVCKLDEVYAIKEKDAPLMGPGWERLDKIAKPKIIELLSSAPIDDTETNMKARRIVNNYLTYTLKSVVNNAKVKSSILDKYCYLVNSFKHHNDNDTAVSVLLSRYYPSFVKETVDSAKTSIAKEVCSMFDEIVTKYPMLQFIDHYIGANALALSAIADYVSLIDSR